MSVPTVPMPMCHRCDSRMRVADGEVTISVEGGGQPVPCPAKSIVHIGFVPEDSSG